ncbi:unnamed protein product [Acanthoscelides obtectus]|uniref:Transposable element P transposase-like RNase H C-terminal domain-containing protein n=1 Tax=Acanthoscelides obtectus TaxID=200917 RepID=A0A9P0KW53_ACAOB|nr:unnamed protein product [Acanthoscelides obtectus]CAK1633712.1 DNA transposase THAP9 [Acanthoscelides obtectus]
MYKSLGQLQSTAIIALLSLVDNFQRQWDVGSAFFVELAVKKLRQPSTEEAKDYLKSLKLGDTRVILSRRKLGFLGFIISINSLYEYRVKETKELKYLLTYNLSQDHLEIFFSCIRSKGGYSNNPTSKQFQNILKKLLLHTEISGNEASNVVALDSTSILHCSSSSLEIKISEDMTSSSNSIEEDEDFIQFKNFLQISPW